MTACKDADKCNKDTRNGKKFSCVSRSIVPSAAIWRQHMLEWWLVSVNGQVITWTTVDLLPRISLGAKLGEIENDNSNIYQKFLENDVCKMATISFMLLRVC